MTGPIKASEFEMEDKKKCLIHGNSGSSKSTLGATAKNPIIGLAESQALRTIRRVNPEAGIWKIESSEDLRGLVAYLKEQHAAGTCAYDTVVLDSLTEIQIMLKREIIAKATEREQLTVGEWGIVIDRVVNICRTFRDLPMHVLILARSEETFIEDTRFVRPSLNGKKLPNDVAGFFNTVGYAYRKISDQGNTIYRILFEGVDGFLCKGDPDLDPVEIPYWPALVRKMYGADIQGAATDAEMEPEFLIRASCRAPAEEIAAKEPTEAKAKDGKGKKGNSDKSNQQQEASA